MKRRIVYLIVALLFIASAQPVFASSARAIRAKAFVLLNEEEAVLFSKNASTRLPAASTVKLMTAMVALDQLDPEAVVTISRSAARTPSSKPRLREGDQLTVEDLLHLALMKSTNSAAVALAEAVGGSEDDFVELMNQKALEIGTTDTLYENATGLPGTEQHTTALDLTIILKNALTYPLIREILGTKQASVTLPNRRVLNIGNTDALLWYRNDVVGGKTGFTNTAQHCFVGAMETGNGIVYTAILGAPPRNKLWKSMSMLIDLSSDPEQFSSVRIVEDTPATKTRKYKRSGSKKADKKI